MCCRRCVLPVQQVVQRVVTHHGLHFTTALKVRKSQPAFLIILFSLLVSAQQMLFPQQTTAKCTVLATTEKQNLLIENLPSFCGMCIKYSLCAGLQRLPVGVLAQWLHQMSDMTTVKCSCNAYIRVLLQTSLLFLTCSSVFGATLVLWALRSSVRNTNLFSSFSF